MPNIDEDAKAWEEDVAGRIGEAVKSRRKAQGLTALQLADATRALGYPVSRVAISKIETNKRAGKLDVAELLVLAAALNTSPVALMYPNPSDDLDQDVKVLPNVEVSTFAAAQWFSGHKHVYVDTTDPTGSAKSASEFRSSNRELSLWREMDRFYELRRNASHVRKGEELSDGQRQQIESYDQDIARIRFELGLDDDA